MKYCTKCGNLISNEEIMCESCLNEMKEKKRKSRKRIIPFVIIFCLVLTVMIYVFSSSYLYNKGMEDRIRAINNLADETTQMAQKYRDQQLQYEISKGKKGAPILGMTAAQVRETSWGIPEDINRTTTKYGTKEQWVYRNGRYLYFEDNVLVSIQD